MILITLVLALVLERFVAHRQDLRDFAWFTRYLQWGHSRLRQEIWHGPVGVLVLLLPPLLAVGLVQHLFDDILWGLLAIPLGVAVLLYCLGPGDLDAEAEDYCDASEEDDEDGAKTAATHLLGHEAPPDPAQRHRLVTDAVLVQSNERLFAVVFWYALLGPLGAALFRLASVLHNNAADSTAPGFAEAARRLHEILGWLPARLVVIGFAITGGFEEAMSGWATYMRERREQYADLNSPALIGAGRGALRLDIGGTAEGDDSVSPQAGDVRAALGMMWRTLLAWMLVVAIVTLAGWTG